MKNAFVAAALGVALTAVPAAAAEDARAAAPAAGELAALVKEFLAGVSRNDAAVHERFWADDLVYTRAAGERIGKADILRDVRSATSQPEEPASAYSAEDMSVRQYGDTAVVAFRLVARTGPDTLRFFNTGTFVRRDGRWQAVAWQATRIPDAEAGDAKADGGGMGQVVLVLLKKGPAWTAEKTDKTRALQEAHMANIKKMWEERKLIVAGPMGDDGDVRGVFVFAAADRALAKRYADSDPAVAAGRLVPEIHSWWVEKRALPEPGAYCR